jgi:hypothetical protein
MANLRTGNKRHNRAIAADAARAKLAKADAAAVAGQPAAAAS